MSKRKVLLVTRPDIGKSAVVSVVMRMLESAGIAVELIDTLQSKRFGQWKKPLLDPTVELVLVLGGDGTILGTAELAKGTPVPILGVNMGHVGFLAEFEEFQIREAIQRVIDRNYQVEKRILADVKAYLPGVDEPLHDWALNEVTIEKSDRGKMVELGIEVDETEVSSFASDGVVISTPTGSTAYAFSAGGPLIWPTLRCLEMAPLAAHALFNRPFVIGDTSSFRVGVLPNSISEGWITCDGRRSTLLPRGSYVDVSVCKDVLNLAHLSEVPFAQRLVTKFDLPVSGWRQKNHPSEFSRPWALAADAGQNATSHSEVNDAH